MKSLNDYIINEMSAGKFDTEIIKLMFGKKTYVTLKIAEAIIDGFMNKLSDKDPNKEREYSTQRNEDRSKLFKIAVDSVGKKTLEEYGIANADVFAQRLNVVIDLLNAALKTVKVKLKDTSVSEAEKQYREWKKSDDYSELEDYDENKEYFDDGENDRPFLIYDAYNPSDLDCVKVYTINGKTSDDEVIHEMNMHRVDWHYETGLHYFRANTCSVEHYRKTDKKNLKNESWLDDSDIK